MRTTSGLQRTLRKAGRVVLWTVIAILLVDGVRSLGRHGEAAPPRTSSTSTPEGSMVGAEAVATRFAVDYLTYDQTHPERRAQALSADLPAGADPTAGWDGHGTQTVAQAMPVSTRAMDAHDVVITVAVEPVGGGWEYVHAGHRDGLRMERHGGSHVGRRVLVVRC